MKHRLLSLLLCLALCCALLPLSALADATVSTVYFTAVDNAPVAGQRSANVTHTWPGNGPFRYTDWYWHAGSAESRLRGDDRFEGGRTYYLRFVLETLGDYVFSSALTVEADRTMAAGAEVTYLSASRVWIDLAYPVAVPTTMVSLVDFSGLRAPVAGASAGEVSSYDLTLPEDADYTAVSMSSGWFEEYEGGRRAMDVRETFTEGVTYSCVLNFMTNDHCCFTDDVAPSCEGLARFSLEGPFDPHIISFRLFFVAAKPGRDDHSAPSRVYYTTQPEGGTVSVGEPFSVLWSLNADPLSVVIERLDGDEWVTETDANPGGGSIPARQSPGTETFRVGARVRGSTVLSQTFTVTWKANVSTVVTLISASIPAPAAGAQPSIALALTGRGVVLRPYYAEGYRNGVRWKDIDSDRFMAESDVFETGHRYRLDLRVIPEVGWSFAVNESGALAAEATVNGMPVTVKVGDETSAELYFEFPPLGAAPAIDRVDVTMRSPEVGGQPPVSAAVPEGAPYTVEWVRWFLAEGGALGTGAVFAPETYIVEISVVPAEGRSFAPDPALSGTLNGKPIQVRNVSDGRALMTFWFDLERVNPFEDVRESDLFYDAVLWAYYVQPQVTNGIDATHFGPNNTVTRGQTVTFLWRAMGCPEPQSTVNPFADVKASDYYYKPVLWAVEQNITKGTDESHFSPDQTCSTAHILTFLYRAMGVGTDGWYQEAESWARAAWLLDGLDLAVSPDVNCPRADVVLFLYRIMTW